MSIIILTVSTIYQGFSSETQNRFIGVCVNRKLNWGCSVRFTRAFHTYRTKQVRGKSEGNLQTFKILSTRDVIFLTERRKFSLAWTVL